ncbi:MAG: hypothetical protein ACLFPL_03760 [Candidatus Nanoarchaeia archaeon]
MRQIIRRMNIVFLFLLSSIFFVGCASGGIGGLFSGGGNTPIGPNEEEDVGDGLQVRIASFNANNLANTQSIFFTLSFENSNLDSIEITRDNIDIITSPSDSTTSSGTLFSQESIDNLYDEIFIDGGSLYVSNSNPFDRQVSLELDEKHTSSNSNYLNSDVTMILNVDYEEEFEYNSNLNVNFQSNSISSSLLSKKGPFDINSFEIIRATSGTKLEFDITSRLSSGSRVDFSPIQITFGSNTLNCDYFYSQDEYETQTPDVIDSSRSSISVICDVPSSVVEEYRDDSTTFTFEAQNDYRHQITLSERFTMPSTFRR